MVLSEDGALLALHCQIYEAALVCVNHERFWQLALPVLIVAALQTEKKKWQMVIRICLHACQKIVRVMPLKQKVRVL